MGKPAIPKYGWLFRRESLPYDAQSSYASRRYVYKGNPAWWVRSQASQPAHSDHSLSGWWNSDWLKSRG
jgi:hypothetical protein